MAGDVDDVVGTGHDEDVARVVEVAGVRGLVVAGKGGEVRLAEALVRLPERWRRAGRHRQLDHQGADLAGWELAAVTVHHPDVPPRHGAGGRAWYDRQAFESEAVGDDRPAGLGLPPVVDHGHAELLLCPAERL